MTGGYEPGTVALVRHQDYTGVAVAAGSRGYWRTPHHAAVSDVDVVRPLVVVDPESEEQVGALLEAMGRHGYTPSPTGDIAEALRSLLSSPKPDEPKGLGAVVEDVSLVEYVHLGSGLWAYGTTDGPSSGFAYADISVVRVLSEGMPA